MATTKTVTTKTTTKNLKSKTKPMIQTTMKGTTNRALRNAVAQKQMANGKTTHAPAQTVVPTRHGTPTKISA